MFYTPAELIESNNRIQLHSYAVNMHDTSGDYTSLNVLYRRCISHVYVELILMFRPGQLETIAAGKVGNQG